MTAGTLQAHPIAERPDMPILKNRMFQPLGILLSNHTMLHIAARGECKVDAAELNGAHLKAVLESGQLALMPLGGQPASGSTTVPASESRKG